MKLRYPIILSCITSLGVVLVNAPAAWLSPLLSKASQGTVYFDQAWGTVWNGQAILLFKRSDSETLRLPDALQWQVNPFELLQGQVQANIGLQGKYIAVKGSLLGAGAKLNIAAGTYTLPASSLNSLGSPFNTLKLAGTVSAQWGAYDLPMSTPANTPPPALPSITLRIDALTSKVIGNRVLGSYQVNLTPQPQGGAQFVLSTVHPSDPLQLKAQGQINVRGQPQFELTAAPAKDSDRESLQAILNLLGRRQGEVNVLKM